MRPNPRWDINILDEENVKTVRGSMRGSVVPFAISRIEISA